MSVANSTSEPNYDLDRQFWASFDKLLQEKNFFLQYSSWKNQEYSSLSTFSIHEKEPDRILTSSVVRSAAHFLQKFQRLQKV
jgi:hypothetical protein